MSTPKTPRKGGRPKGSPKTGGRAKGTLNKNRLFLKDHLASAGFDFAKAFALAFSKLTPQEQMKALSELMPFLAPRMLDKEATVQEDTASDDSEESTADLLSIVKK